MIPLTAPELMLAVLLLPLAGTLLIAMSEGRPNQRETVTVVVSLLLLACVASLVPSVLDGERPTLTVAEMMPGLTISFTLEPLGMMFACIASSLWILNSFYSIGYMRAKHEEHQTRFYACFAIAIWAAQGVAMAGNMLTLFVFYEVLTISTYPLVTHSGTREAVRSGRLYLGLLIGSSIGLQLPAIIWTWQLTGTLDFAPSGILSGHIEGPATGLLLFLYMFGIGKAALMPLHRWLPAAMVAPTPVSALLHAVAVVKAGVFTVLKVIVYLFGIEFLAASGFADWLVWVAATTMLLASLIAMTKDNLKARLAYSTVSQLSYVVLGAALFTPLGIIGAAMHIAMHAVGKITLFFCAGAIYVATGKTQVSQLNGLGRKMPFTFAAFGIAAVSVIGLPPLGGAWSKYYLAAGAVDSGQLVFVAALMVSSLLNVAYLVPIVARGFFLPTEGGQPDEAEPGSIQEAPAFCVVPLCATAVGCILLFFFAGSLYDLLLPIVGGVAR